MRRYLFFFLLTVGGLSSAWMVLFSLQLGQPTESGEVLHYYYSKKDAIARETRGSRIFVVGGSNVHYSTETYTLGKVFRRPFLNFGSHGGLQLPYILDRAGRHVRAGDTVILQLNFGHFQYGGRMSDTFLDFAVAWDPDYIRSRPFRERLQIALSFNLLGLANPDLSILHRLNSKTIDDPERAAQFGQFLSPSGDYDYGTRALQSEASRAAVDAARPLSLEFSSRDPSWDVIADFITEMRSQGATVLAAWPITIEQPEYHEPPAQAAFGQIRAFYEKLDVPIAGTPEQFWFPRSYFFDTSLHILREYRDRPTEVLRAELAPLLEGGPAR